MNFKKAERSSRKQHNSLQIGEVGANHLFDGADLSNIYRHTQHVKALYTVVQFQGTPVLSPYSAASAPPGAYQPWSTLNVENKVEANTAQ